MDPLFWSLLGRVGHIDAIKRLLRIRQVWKKTLLTFQGQPNTQCTWWRNDHFLGIPRNAPNLQRVSYGHSIFKTYLRNKEEQDPTTAMPAIAFGRRAFLGGPVTQWRTVTHRSQSWFEALRAGPYHLVAAWQGHQTCPSKKTSSQPLAQWWIMWIGVSWRFMVFHGVSVNEKLTIWTQNSQSTQAASRAPGGGGSWHILKAKALVSIENWISCFFSMHKPKSQKSLWHGKTTSRSNSYKVHAARSKFTLAFPHSVWREALTCPKHLDMSDFIWLDIPNIPTLPVTLPNPTYPTCS